jgi:hypothetical protein
MTGNIWRADDPIENGGELKGDKDELKLAGP